MGHSGFPVASSSETAEEVERKVAFSRIYYSNGMRWWSRSLLSRSLVGFVDVGIKFLVNETKLMIWFALFGRYAGMSFANAARLIDLAI